MAHKLQSPVAGCYFVSCLMLMHFAEFGATKTSAAEDNQLPAAWTRQLSPTSSAVVEVMTSCFTGASLPPCASSSRTVWAALSGSGVAC